MKVNRSAFNLHSLASLSLLLSVYSIFLRVFLLPLLHTFCLYIDTLMSINYDFVIEEEKEREKTKERVEGKENEGEKKMWKRNREKQTDKDKERMSERERW